MDRYFLRLFLQESNKIEGIFTTPSTKVLDEAYVFLMRETLELSTIENFVSLVEPEGKLRTDPGMNVYIGDHVPPPGGPAILYKLMDLLDKLDDKDVSPFEWSCKYLNLHPFTDGNGRSSRIIWLWMMRRRNLPIFGNSFLHTWYYQSLDNFDERLKG